MKLMERVNRFLGNQPEYRTLFGMVEDLVNAGERLQEEKTNAYERVQSLENEYRLYENYLLGRLQKAESSEYIAMLQDDNKRLCREVCRLRQKTSFKVYEENVRLQQELALLKGELSDDAVW